MKTDLIEKLNSAAMLVTSLRDSILKMCDDMDAAPDILEKEVIRQSILVTEDQMKEAELIYREILEETSK